jgi:hypothetical protein
MQYKNEAFSLAVQKFKNNIIDRNRMGADVGIGLEILVRLL